MSNLKVSLIIYVKMETGEWKRFPVVRNANGTVRKGTALVGENDERKFDNFTYQLRSYEGRKTVYKNLGRDAAGANDQQKTAAQSRKVRHEAKKANVAVVENSDRLTIEDAIKRYLDHAKGQGTIPAYNQYRCTLEHFRDSVRGLTYVDEIDEKTMHKFHAHLAKIGNAPRTIANRHAHVKGMLIWFGWTPATLDRKLGREPKFDKKLPVCYSDDELSTLWATAVDWKDDRYIYTVLKLLQMTGMRWREAAHLMWTDVDFKRGLIKICAKPDMKFHLKDREDREVTIPPKLVPILRERREKMPKARLVVGNSNDQPSARWLLLLKRVSHAAGLWCGHCKGCRVHVEAKAASERWANNVGCYHWSIHNFRRTYATHLHRNGWAVRDIMQLLGHSNLETTMRYLASATSDDHKAKMANVEWP